MIDDKPTLDISEPAPELPKPKRLLPKRKFQIKDKKKFVRHILDNLKQDLQDREMRMQRRLRRLDKLSGWLPSKSYPWEDCANFQVPAMLIAHLKMAGTLQNALKSMRPMETAKAKQRRNSGRETMVDNVLDFQFFVENQGETIIDNLTTQFCQDEAVFATVQWVKETQTFHDVRILPALQEGASIEAQLLEALTVIYPSMIAQRATDNDFYEWEVLFSGDDGQARLSKCCFYQMDDGQIQAAMVTQVTTFDGPSLQVKNFEDIVFPIRSSNLQPPSETNPDGAPYYNELFTFNTDVCQRRFTDGSYDQLDQQAMDRIMASNSVAGTGDESDTPKEQLDRHEGIELSKANKREDRQGVKHFGRYDVDGDGLEEDIIAWIARDAEELLAVRLLTEVFPVVPISRPIAHTAFEPTPNRIYGRSQAEILENLEDAMTTMLNQHVDYGTLTNLPFGTYRASSGLKGEPIHLEPGMMIALDDPVNDINFPAMPQKDSAFALNTMAVLQQFVERLQMAGDTSFGRVPQGKASALRTAGTTMALLAPADDRAEQILRRLFGLFSSIFQFSHALNRRYLPKQKEIRMVGMSEAGEEAYANIDADDVDFEVDFEWKGSLINANKQMISQALTEAMAIIVSPLALQAGIVSPEQIYRLFKDKLKALDLDPDKYLMRPPNPMPGPPMLAEEVISALIEMGKGGSIPVGRPLEFPQEHLMKLQAFMQSPQFGFLTMPEQLMALQVWMEKVQALIMQQQMLMGAAGAGVAQKAEGEGGKETTVSSEGTGTASNQNLNGNELIDESIAPVGTA